MGVEADDWRLDTKSTIIQLIHEMVATLRDGRHAGIVGDECVAYVGRWKIGRSDDIVGLLRSHNDSCNLSRRPKGHTTVSLRWKNC